MKKRSLFFPFSPFPSLRYLLFTFLEGILTFFSWQGIFLFLFQKTAADNFLFKHLSTKSRLISRRLALEPFCSRLRKRLFQPHREYYETRAISIGTTSLVNVVFVIIITFRYELLQFQRARIVVVSCSVKVLVTLYCTFLN